MSPSTKTADARRVIPGRPEVRFSGRATVPETWLSADFDRAAHLAPTVGTEHDRLLSGRKTAAPPTSLTTTRSHSCGRAWRAQLEDRTVVVPGSAANPTIDRARSARWAETRAGCRGSARARSRASSAAFLIFVSLTRSAGSRPGGGHDDGVALAAAATTRRELRGRLDRHQVTPAASGSATLAATRVTLAPRRRGAGQGVALEARRAVAEEAHPVEALPGAARRDDDATTGQVEASRTAAASTSSRPRRRPVGQPALAGVLAGHDLRRARRRRRRGAQGRDVGLGGGVSTSRCAWPGRRRPGACGEQRVGQQVVGQPWAALASRPRSPAPRRRGRGTAPIRTSAPGNDVQHVGRAACRTAPPGGGAHELEADTVDDGDVAPGLGEPPHSSQALYAATPRRRRGRSPRTRSGPGPRGPRPSAQNSAAAQVWT